jgi:threonine dehydrogenase-like Zn-dependent dehydrogenase
MRHGEQLVEWSKAYGGPFNMDLNRPVVMGHEYVGEIIDYGPGTSQRLKKGSRVTSTPALIRETGLLCVGLSNDAPGGFGEYMVLNEALLQPVPDALGIDLAAMAEPVSVGMYYVRDARLTSDDTPLVIGCGAIGLAMILALKLTKARPIIAADYSESRRKLALAMGADIVIDPAAASPYSAQTTFGGKIPNVIFECVGVPGVMDGIIRACAPGARIMVSGWCLETDHMFTPAAHTKGLTIKYGGGPQLEDFEAAVRGLGDGVIDPTPWIGQRVGLGGVSAALEGIQNSANPIRTIVDPRMEIPAPDFT